MLDIERSHAAIIACYASARALDCLPVPPGVHGGRVAPDELLLIVSPARGPATQEHATAHLGQAERSALVLDQSDAWATFSLRGDGALRALAQLSAIPFPDTRPAFVQGAVAGGPAKVLLVDGAVHILVPFTLRHHLEGRLRDVCGPGVRIGAEEIAYTGSPARTASGAEYATAAGAGS